MDFKSLINKISEMDDKIESVAAPELPKSVQLNEDATLRVLAGTSTYVAEAKKKAEEKVDEVFDADAKTGDKAKTSKGVVTKTDKGIVHKSTSAYGGSEDKPEDDEEESKSKKKAKKESIDAEAFKGKFAKMVEAKKDDKKDDKKKKPMKEAAKPDFLDMDKDGDKKEPMKKAVADKKKGAVGKKDETTDEGIIGGAAKLVGKAIGGVAKGAGAIAGVKDGVKKAFGKGKKSSIDTISGDDKKNESKKMKKDMKVVKESVEPKLTFKDMVKLVQESGGQQAIDPVDAELFNWASRVAKNKLGEGMKAELYAGLIYERNGGVFQMYDVLSEDQK